MIERDPRHAELLTQDLRHLSLGDEPGFDEHRADATPVALLGDQDLLELSTADNLSLDEEITQPDAYGNHRDQI